MICQKCETENIERAKFCRKCGSNLQPISQVESQKTNPQISIDLENADSAQTEQSKSTNQTIDHLSGPKEVISNVGTRARKLISRVDFEDPNLSHLFSGLGSPQIRSSWYALFDNQNKELDLKVVIEEIKNSKDPDFEVELVPLVQTSESLHSTNFVLCRLRNISCVIGLSKRTNNIVLTMINYIKTPINRARAYIAGLLVIISLYMFLIFPIQIGAAFRPLMASGFSSLSGNSVFFNLFIVIGPLGIINNALFVCLLIYNFYQWKTNGDFWVLLRSKPDEFQLAEMHLFSMILRQTTRTALEKIGIHSDSLQPIDPDNLKEL